MKNIITTIALILITLAASAQSEKLQAALGQTMAGYATAQSTDDFQALSNSFKRIADAEPSEWLPRYYQIHALVVGNFSSQASAAERDQLLDEAQAALDQLKELDPSNSEVMVLQGLLYTGRLVIDPQTRGQQYGAMSAQAIGQALGMDPSNARALAMQLSNEHGTAQFFGKDLSEYCERGKKLVASWDELDQPASPLHPSWGKDQAQRIASACDKK